MFSICYYSGLPYLCALCPEDDAPCYYMKNKRFLNKMLGEKKRGDAVSTASPQLCNSLSHESPNNKSKNPDNQEVTAST